MMRFCEGLRRATLLLVLVEGAAWAADRLEVETRPASLVGLTALSVNGRIQPHGAPATYFFEYGPTAEYGRKTAEFPLPPQLAAYYHESWDKDLAGWSGGMNGQDLTYHAKDGAAGGFVRFSEPSGDDPNHVDGIGTLHLSSYFYPATHPGPGNLLASWGGGDPDLRDARVRIAVRGQQWVANGAEVVWWTQSDNDITQQFTPNWRRANWAYTGFSLNDFLQSGKWEQVEYRLTNDTHAWTYGGNNLAQARPNYAYWPINDSLAHLSCDFFHLSAFVNPEKRPTGAIDFDEFEVAYRNYSLTWPGNGGSLIELAVGSDDDPGALTDGWRHGKGRQWASGEKPFAPVEITYEFANPVTIESVQLHQHTEWPAKEVEILISEDGKSWDRLLRKELPENHPAGPNFAFLLERGLKARAKQAAVRIISGYKPQRWGLGEIEFFGKGAVMQTDGDWYHVNLDISDLRPGETCHYRLVAKTEAGMTAGSDQAFTMPADTKPHVVTGAASRIQKDSAKVEGRLNPLGKKTQFHFEYGRDATYGQKTEPQYGGLQVTPRTAFATLTGLAPGTEYHYRLVGTNETGTSVGANGVLRTKE